jgi:hypothetical protein
MRLFIKIFYLLIFLAGIVITLYLKNLLDDFDYSKSIPIIISTVALIISILNFIPLFFQKSSVKEIYTKKVKSSSNNLIINFFFYNNGELPTFISLLNVSRAVKKKGMLPLFYKFKNRFILENCQFTTDDEMYIIKPKEIIQVDVHVTLHTKTEYIFLNFKKLNNKKHYYSLLNISQ